jgi:hypothetical protein
MNQTGKHQMMTVSQFWDWLDRHDDRQFWDLFNEVFDNAPPALKAAMDKHADYVLAAEDAALYRAETNFRC